MRVGGVGASKYHLYRLLFAIFATKHADTSVSRRSSSFSFATLIGQVISLTFCLSFSHFPPAVYDACSAILVCIHLMILIYSFVNIDLLVLN